MVKIKRCDDVKYVDFGSIPFGEFFIYEDNLYIKAYYYKDGYVAEPFGIQIDTGREFPFVDSEIEVEHVDVEICII